MGRPLYTTRFVLFAAGLVGSAVSLLVQLSAPGSAIRVEKTATLEYTNAVHELPSLVARTLESSFMIMGHPGSILGFMLMMVVGLAVTLVICRPKQLQMVDRSLKVAAAPFILGLILHLLLVPSIWMSGSAQTTDLKTYQDRYDFGPMSPDSLHRRILSRSFGDESKCRHFSMTANMAHRF